MEQVNEDRFFIMMNTLQRRTIIPLLNKDNEVAMFSTRGKAILAVDGNNFADAFGYEIFETGAGL